jgi:hypothetical protein
MFLNGELELFGETLVCRLIIQCLILEVMSTVSRYTTETNNELGLYESSGVTEYLKTLQDTPFFQAPHSLYPVDFSFEANSVDWRYKAIYKRKQTHCSPRTRLNSHCQH